MKSGDRRTGEDTSVPIVGRPPSDEEEFYLTWGQELPKNSLTLLNDVLKQLVTLNTALLGGSVVFLNGAVMDAWFRNVVIIMFFLSLCTSFVGILPYIRKTILDNPDTVKLVIRSAFTWKLWLIRIAAAFLALGFIVALVGLAQ
jgi:hypothetical protein